MKRRFPRTAAVTAAALVLAGGGTSAAFAGDPTDNPSEAAADLCANINELSSDTAALRALNPSTTTKDQIKDATNEVHEDWKKVAESTATWNQAKKNALKTASQNLQKAYENLPGDTTGSQAATQLAPQVQALSAAIKNARTELTCP
ncbi:hypothetical protein HYE82_34895 [Streptomyces sp. BR123]|uniref:hypothetical protein n=1 Tax=Streptomyces sp. BR123 TaxID=2749828 RepID=UPI0015C48AC6|nr:hypothetical protein [Streptomyces sp. BR123]NXY99472.1 hypothetical protein [Streptomyces sp. BR123]